MDKTSNISPSFIKFIDTINDAILVVDKKGIIIETNQGAQDTFLYQKDELIGKPISTLMPKKFREKHKSHFSDYTRNPVFRTMGEKKELQAERKNGSIFDVDIALSFFEENGQRYYIASLRDITHIRDIERELKVVNENLHEFASMVTHDLKAPINNIQSLLQMLNADQKDYLANAQAKKFVSLAISETTRISKLVEDILEFSKTGKVDLEIVEFDLSELIASVLKSLAYPDTMKVEVNSQVKRVKTSYKLLFQVLSNLIGNAFKYHDKEDGRVIISAKKGQDVIRLTVEDDGPGIHQSCHEKIFDMFGTANDTRRTDSTGVGLAIVAKVVKQNGGQIQVKSTLGSGARFDLDWKIIR